MALSHRQLGLNGNKEWLIWWRVELDSPETKWKRIKCHESYYLRKSKENLLRNYLIDVKINDAAKCLLALLFSFFTKWWLFIDVQTYKILSTILFMTESERAWVYSWLTWQTYLHCIKSFKTSMQNSLLLFLSSNMAAMKLGVNLGFQWGIVLKGYHSLE